MTTLDVVRGLSNSAIPEAIVPNTIGKLAWTNISLTSAGPVNTDDVVALILKLLLSTGYTDLGSPPHGVNYSALQGSTNWDQFEQGIGLGIPQGQVDIGSFTRIQGQFDWDPNQKLYFHIKKPQPAKQFIEEELCRPFGLYLRTGNDGIIRLVRPRHPQKYYIGATNQTLTVLPYLPFGHVPTSMQVPIGVYSGPELASLVSSSLSARSLAVNLNQPIPFTCTYDTVNHRFSIQSSGGLHFDIVQSVDSGWQTLGWTAFGGANTTNVTTSTADTETGQFSGPALSQNDMWGVTPLENGDDQVTRVVYLYDYNADKDDFATTRLYVDSDAIARGEVLGAKDFVIRSKGLVSGGLRGGSAFTYFAAPSQGSCVAPIFGPDEKSGVDNDTWALLYAKHLFDRYKYPPIKFRAHLKWAQNTLEIGDIVRVNYSIPGVLLDSELETTTINRLFEVVEIHPNFDGSVEATFLGHRYVSY